MSTSTIDLANFSAVDGYVITGASSDSLFGISISGRGDVNGDGFLDIVIGSPYSDFDGLDDRGYTYVIFGSASQGQTLFDVSTLNGSNGFVIRGVALADASGIRVSSDGDYNDDGIADILIGSAFGDPLRHPAEAYLLYGSTASFSAFHFLSDLNGSNGFVLKSEEPTVQYVANAGDINGDDIDDLIISSSRQSAFVVFGASMGLSANIDLSDLNGASGFQVTTSNSNLRWVSGLGDINGDGIDDFIIGAHSATPTSGAFRPRAGQSYVIFGSTSGFAASIDVSALNGSNGFALNGINFDDHSGTNVSSAGDMNGDGLDDFIITAFLADPDGRVDAGASYVIFGSTNPFPSQFELSSLDGSNGFSVGGMNSGDKMTRAVSAGDFNGDGFDDLLASSGSSSPGGRSQSGQSYVIFGASAGFGASFEITSINGANGFVINGANEYDYSGSSLAPAGDMNDDGFDDILIGANGFDGPGGPASGAVFVVFGRPSFGVPVDGSLGSDSLAGTSFADFIRGLGSSDTLSGLGRDDTLEGNAGRDLIFGGDDNDLLYGFGSHDSLFGGNGDDDLRGNDGKDLLAGSGGNDIARGGRGDDRLFGGGGIDTLYGNDGNDSLTGGGGGDRLKGDAGADTLNGRFGADTVSGGAGDDLFEFRQGHGADIIDDFTAGAGSEDVIKLIAFGAAFDSFVEVLAASTQVGADVFIDFGGGDSITLLNVAFASLYPDDLTFA